MPLRIRVVRLDVQRAPQVAEGFLAGTGESSAAPRLASASA